MDIKTVSLKEFSSLKIGGEGKLVEVSTTEELKEAVMYAKTAGLRVHILGGATNTYFGENLSDFLFVRSNFQGVRFEEKDEEVIVTAEASVVWDDLVQTCVEKGLWGIENLSYIPGTVGAAPVQNIGAYGIELQEVFISLEALDMDEMNVITLDRESCQFGYRDSIFKYNKGKYVILSITLKLYSTPHPVLLYKPLDELQGKENLKVEDVRNAVIDIRTKKLPNYHEHPNAGSFFKNPIVDLEAVEYAKTLYPDMPSIQMPEGYKIPAAWLIEHVAEMKRAKQGNIGTWPHQPLVLVNYGDATADELDAFAKEITKRVNEKVGIVLEQEVNRVG